MTESRFVYGKSFKRLIHRQLPDSKKYQLTNNSVEEHSMTTPFRLALDA